MRTFALVSLISGIAAIGLLWFFGAERGDQLSAREALAAGFTGWLMSTAGIGLLVAGALARPEATLNFCIAGMVAKLLVFATAVAVVIGAGKALGIRLDAFVIATLIAFLAVGVVQFGLAVRTLGSAASFEARKIDQTGPVPNGQG